MAQLTATLRRPTLLSLNVTAMLLLLLLLLLSFFLLRNDTLQSQPNKSPLTLLIGTAAALTAFLFLFIEPIPQPQSYHDLADRRSFRCGCCSFFFGRRGRNQRQTDIFLPPNMRGKGVIPNFGDVTSNVIFFLGGFVGLIAVLCVPSLDDNLAGTGTWQLDTCLPTFFGGTIAVSVGSTYYHWNPTDATLVWDRLPMTVAFMAIFSFVIDEYLPGQDVGESVLVPFLGVGIASVAYWACTDDLRLYALVAIGPMLFMPFIIASFVPRHTGTAHQALALALYGAAKLCEEKDWEIWRWTGRRVSGHTLKHVLAGLAPLSIAHMILVREHVS